jgi:hypothetical protein
MWDLLFCCLFFFLLRRAFCLIILSSGVLFIHSVVKGFWLLGFGYCCCIALRLL